MMMASIRKSSYLQILAGLAVVLIALLAARPLFDPRLHHAYDTLTHFYKQVQLDHLVRHGILYPRWFPHKGSGFGAPLFQYYAPLAYYVTELPILLGLKTLPAMRLVFGLTLLGAGLGSCLWVRDQFGTGPGLVAAAAYVSGPYMLFSIYFRGGFTEQFALMLMPWVLWAFRRLALTGRSRYLAAAALGYAAVLLSHTLTALLFSAALAAYSLVLALGRARRAPGASVLRSLLRQWTALALGLGLSAFFWLPALLERNALRTDLAYVNAGLDFHNNFVPLRRLVLMPISASIRPGLSLVVLVLALAALVGLLWRGPLRRQAKVVFDALQTLEVCLALLVLGACILMVLPAAVGVWEVVPPMRMFQFPHRFLAVGSLFAAMLGGAGIFAASKWFLRTGWETLLLVLVATVLLLNPMRGLAGVQYFQDLPEVDVNFIMQKEREAGSVIGKFTGVYIPAAVQEPPSFEEQSRDGPERLDTASLPAGASVLAADYGLLNYDLTFSSPQPFTAVFRTFHFPGWQAQLDGQAVGITPTQPHGQISVDVPAGEHRLTVRFGPTPLRTAATVLSLVSGLILLGLVVWRVLPED